MLCKQEINAENEFLGQLSRAIPNGYIIIDRALKSIDRALKSIDRAFGALLELCFSFLGNSRAMRWRFCCDGLVSVSSFRRTIFAIKSLKNEEALY